MPSCKHHDICGVTDEADPATGMCILHSKDPDKDKQTFAAALGSHRKRKGDKFVLFVFPDATAFSGEEFLEGPNFSGATFIGDAIFRGTFKKGANFSRCKFERGATFAYFLTTGEEGKPEVNFSETTFANKADFRSGMFLGRANFCKAKFEKGADFLKARFGEHLSFWEAECAGEMNFTEVHFEKGAGFNKSIFNGVAVFQRATFQDEDTTFVQTVFKEKPDFILTVFHREAVFRGATFAQGADFPEAKLLSGIDFRPDFEATLDQRDFSIEGFGRLLRYQTRFLGDTDFSGAIFGGVVNFHQAYMNGKIVFKRSLTQPIFQGADVAFSEVSIGPSGAIEFFGVDLSKCRFLHTDLRKVQIIRATWAKVYGRLVDRFLPREGIYDELAHSNADANYPWEGIERAYRELKQNHEDRRDYERAGDFHYGEKEMRRCNPTTSLGLRFWLTLYWLISGYGERYVRPLVWSFILIVLSTLGYVAFGLRLRPEQGGAILSVTSFWDWLLTANYSLRVMTLLKPEDLIPVGCAKFINTAQGVLGPLFLGLFALALRQRLRR